MRDFRDAKAMAQTLRDSLTQKAISISHSESLELVSRMLGLADWNTLAALLQSERRDPPPRPRTLQGPVAIYPALPLRDLVPFPTATYPLFVRRPKTVQALNQAFERQREVVLAVQREAGVDEPGFEDLYEIGVLAQLLELEPLPDGTIKVLAQGIRRVAIRGFTMQTGAFEAEVADVSEGPIPDTPDLIRRTVTQFDSYARVLDIRMPNTSPPLDQTRDPGRVADIIAARIRMPIDERYTVLATIDPVMRLERVGALVDLSARPFSPVLEATQRRALNAASLREHQYATLEHLLLALIGDTDARSVMEACDGNLERLNSDLIQAIEDGQDNSVSGTSRSAEPSKAFQRTMQRAIVHAQEVGWSVVTGANALFAIFAETRSPAAHLLREHGVSIDRAAKAIAQGIGKGTG